MGKKQFAIIGLGRFGSNMAIRLHKMGMEVLAIDQDPGKVQDIVTHVTQAVQADSTDEEALRSLGIRNFDVVVVAIGQDIQSSILTTLILKDMGIKKLLAKAQNELHGKVLKKIGADKVIFPEQDMALRVSNQLIFPNIIDYIQLSDDYSIAELQATKAMTGKNLKQLNVRAKYRCNVLAIKTGESMNVAPNPEDMIKLTDIVVVVGKNSDIQAMEQAFN